jgi:hypothetical protein
MMGMAMSDNLGKDIGDAAKFSGNGFFRGAAAATMRNKQNYGSNKMFNAQNWQPNDFWTDVGRGYGAVGSFAAGSLSSNIQGLGGAMYNFWTGNWAQGVESLAPLLKESPAINGISKGAQMQFNQLPDETKQRISGQIIESDQFLNSLLSEDSKKE